MRAWLEWRWKIWRIRHYVWLAYLHWYNHPSDQTYNAWRMWNVYLDRVLTTRVSTRRANEKRLRRMWTVTAARRT